MMSKIVLVSPLLSSPNSSPKGSARGIMQFEPDHRLSMLGANTELNRARLELEEEAPAVGGSAGNPVEQILRHDGAGLGGISRGPGAVWAKLEERHARDYVRVEVEGVDRQGEVVAIDVRVARVDALQVELPGLVGPWASGVFAVDEELGSAYSLISWL